MLIWAAEEALWPYSDTSEGKEAAREALAEALRVARVAVEQDEKA